MSAKIYFADLACGGGLASAGVLAGLEGRGRCVVAVDPWEPAQRVYRLNHPGTRVLSCKAEDLSPDDLRGFALEAGAPPASKLDLIISGPPCQGDSALNRCRSDRPDRRDELAVVKLAVADLRQAARVVVMETVGRHWAAWGEELGAQVVSLHDDRLGGYTVRKRTLLVWGVQADATELAYTFQGPTVGSWGNVLPEWAGHDRVMANDADTEVKRRRKGGIERWDPGYAIVGHGTSHRIMEREPGRTGPLQDGETWEYVHRLTPLESLRMQGHLTMRLPEGADRLPVRVAQTVVGNGWPESYGRAVARMVLA